MDESTRSLILVILIMLLMVVLAFMGSRIMMKRAVGRVIKAFRDHNALDPSKALMQEEIGLKPRGILEFRGLRDYKPMALQLLMRHDIVRMTDDGRLYLSEEALAQTTLSQDKR